MVSPNSFVFGRSGQRICPGNYKEIEKFADLLDITIVNLKEKKQTIQKNLMMAYYT